MDDGFGNSNRESIKKAVLSMKAIVSSQSARMALAKREKLPKEFSKRDKIVQEAAKLFVTNEFKEVFQSYSRGDSLDIISNIKIDKLVENHGEAIRMYGSIVAPIHKKKINELKNAMNELNPEEVYIALQLGKKKNTSVKQMNVSGKVSGNGNVIENVGKERRKRNGNKQSLHEVTKQFFKSLKPLEMYNLFGSLSLGQKTVNSILSVVTKSKIYSKSYGKFKRLVSEMKIEKQFKKEIAHVLKTYGSQKNIRTIDAYRVKSKQPESKQPESNNNNYTIQKSTY